MKKNMLFLFLFVAMLAMPAIILCNETTQQTEQGKTTTATATTAETTAAEQPELPLEKKSAKPWSFADFWKRFGYFFGFGEKTSYDIATEV